MKVLVVIGVILAASAIQTDALAVMSVDIGSEFLKVAIVKPGVPMEIVLNKESGRKTAAIVSLHKGERLFSDPALATGLKFPAQAYWYVTELLGKTLDNPIVKRFQKSFPYYKLEADPDTNMVVFRHDDDTIYLPEELLAMMLQHCKENAESFAEQPISEAVVTIPPHFNQAERRAVVRAVELAGLKLLQLMNDNAAVALNYGIFRRKEFNSTKVRYMFFDMGAMSTTATVVEYAEVKEKSKATGVVDKFPQLTVLGVGYDRSLGGLEFTIRLRDHLARVFNEQKKTTNNIFDNPRAMAKLLKEAGRVKRVLSANADHYAQVEGLLDEHDFKARVTRDEFELMCKDLFEKVHLVVEQALQTSEVSLEELKEVILMGGGTRVPKVQDELIKVIKRQELGKSINTDESAVLGAVYQAAHLGKGFKVKKFAVKDANLHPIVTYFPVSHIVNSGWWKVEFERIKQLEDGQAADRVIKRVLFGRFNTFPQNKVMTFNKHVNDFTFHVAYGDLDYLNDESKSELGERHLQSVSLAGVAEAYEKHKDTGESKGIKAHFRMDESGIVLLTKVEFQFEKQHVEEEVDVEKDEQSAFSKLGDTLSSFFKSAEPKDKLEEGMTEETPENTIPEQDDGEKKEPQEENEEQEQATDTAKESEKAPNESPEGDSKDEQKPKEEEPKTKDEKEEKKLKTVLIREDIVPSINKKDLLDPTSEQLKASKAKLKALNDKDAARLELAKAQNDLETFLVDSNDKLYQDDYIKVSTDAEREEISKQLSAGSDWLLEQEADAPPKVYKEKLRELKKATNDVWERVKEMQERPRAIEALNSMLNHSAYFLVTMKNYTSDEPGEKPFTTVEFQTLQKLIMTTKEWNDTVVKEQAKNPLTSKPKFTIMDVAQRIHDLEREVKYLVGKAKTFRPKPVKKEAAAANETKANTTKAEKTIGGKKKNDTAKTQEEKPEEFDTSSFEEEFGENKEEVKESKQDKTEGGEKEEGEPLMLGDGDSNSADPTKEPVEQDIHYPGEL